ncbi:hypothetical protein [Bradyrhizobium sp. th.b2]|uniref:hypothetical protein n=1 Tax=Bradyrhizobium sp. th-b2 TaxID=172088 RepID=UPI0003F90F47|nr:hypothetical protein [Bradyrhizobium sp. th.b2]
MVDFEWLYWANWHHLLLLRLSISNTSTLHSWKTMWLVEKHNRRRNISDLGGSYAEKSERKADT